MRFTHQICIAICGISLFCAPLQSNAVSYLRVGAQVDNSGDAVYIGTWERVASDDTGYTRIRLTLLANGTYRRVMEANLRNHAFSQSDTGNWRATGPIVQLSGDGNAPGGPQDLRYFKKIVVKPTQDH